jgi:hypothetical protein
MPFGGYTLFMFHEGFGRYLGDPAKHGLNCERKTSSARSSARLACDSFQRQIVSLKNEKKSLEFKEFHGVAIA